jgi:hypothetical protein
VAALPPSKSTQLNTKAHATFIAKAAYTQKALRAWEKHHPGARALV